MKRIGSTAIALLLLMTSLKAFSTRSTSDYLVPKELAKANVYVEKFSPIYIQDISEKQLHRIEYINDHSMSDFLELLNAYNVVYYRKFNDYIAEIIESRNYADRMKPMYLRDFNETADTTIRYIITNDFSIIDIYLNEEEGSQHTVDDKFSYYILDKQTGVKYRKEDGVDDLLTKIDYLYKLDEKGKLDRMTQDQLDNELRKVGYKAKKQKSGNGLTWGVVIFSGIGLLLNLVLNT